MNLDGVVNDAAWLDAMRAGTAGERLHAEGVRWYVNHSSFEEGRCGSLEEALAVLDPRRAGDLELVEAWPFEQVGILNGVDAGRHQMATCVMRLSGG